MSVYIAVLAVVFISALIANNDLLYVDDLGRSRYGTVGNASVIFALTVLILVAGFRWNIGTDMMSYVSQYDARKTIWLSSLREFKEPGINIIAKIGSLIYDEPISMVFGASLITVLLFFLTIKKYGLDLPLSMTLFVLVGTWHGSFNGIRQYLAAAVIFAGHRYIYEKKFYRYAICVLIAMLFHRTALVMLPAYFIVRLKPNLKNIIGIAIAVLAIRFSYDSIFDFMGILRGTEIERFDYMISSVHPLRIAVTFAPLVLFVLVSRKNTLKDKETSFYLMLVVLNAVFSYGTAGSTYLARATIYTEAYVVLYYPRVLKGFSINSKRVTKIGILVCYFVFWIFSLYAANVIPYTTWFNY